MRGLGDEVRPRLFLDRTRVLSRSAALPFAYMPVDLVSTDGKYIIFGIPMAPPGGLQGCRTVYTMMVEAPPVVWERSEGRRSTYLAAHVANIKV